LAPVQSRSAADARGWRRAGRPRDLSHGPSVASEPARARAGSAGGRPTGSTSAAPKSGPRPDACAVAFIPEARGRRDNGSTTGQCASSRTELGRPAATKLTADDRKCAQGRPRMRSLRRRSAHGGGGPALPGAVRSGRRRSVPADVCGGTTGAACVLRCERKASAVVARALPRDRSEERLQAEGHEPSGWDTWRPWADLRLARDDGLRRVFLRRTDAKSRRRLNPLVCRALDGCGFQMRSDLLRAAGAQTFRKTNMRTLVLGLVATTSLLGASLAGGGAQADPQAKLISGVYTVGDAPTLQRAQFVFGGRDYCWYVGGWRGPGYYWCGYAWRRGYGWGGGEGWNGWRGGGRGSRGGSHFSGAGVRSGGVGMGGVHSSGVRGAGAFGGAGGVHSSGVHSAGVVGGGGSHGGGGHSGGGGGHGGSPGGGGHGGAGQKRG